MRRQSSASHVQQQQCMWLSWQAKIVHSQNSRYNPALCRHQFFLQLWSQLRGRVVINSGHHQPFKRHSMRIEWHRMITGRGRVACDFALCTVLEPLQPWAWNSEVTVWRWQWRALDNLHTSQSWLCSPLIELVWRSRQENPRIDAIWPG